MMSIISIMALLIMGCATAAQKPSIPQEDKTLQAVENSAKRIEDNIRQLVILQTTAGQHQGGLRAVLPKSGRLGKSITLNWKGPIEPALEEIAKAIHYKSKILGTAPPTPIVVIVNAEKAPAYDVLDGIAWQAANKAQILVDPLMRRITLAYLPIFGAQATPDHSFPTVHKER